jgi:hypothetical protein
VPPSHWPTPRHAPAYLQTLSGHVPSVSRLCLVISSLSSGFVLPGLLSLQTLVCLVFPVCRLCFVMVSSVRGLCFDISPLSVRLALSGLLSQQVLFFMSPPSAGSVLSCLPRMQALSSLVGFSLHALYCHVFSVSRLCVIYPHSADSVLSCRFIQQALFSHVASVSRLCLVTSPQTAGSLMSCSRYRLFGDIL